MLKVLMTCHGNICRSTMAQYVLQDMVERRGIADQFYIDSAATSREEIGNPPHYGTRNKLRQMGIHCGEHRAVQLCKGDYDTYDYLIGMDTANIRNMLRMTDGELRMDGNREVSEEGKIAMLLDFSDRPRPIADPWYTGNFDETYDDVVEGCEAFLAYLEERGEIDVK